MKLLQKLKNELIYGGLTKEEFRQVREPVRDRNRRSVIFWSASGCTRKATPLKRRTGSYWKVWLPSSIPV